MVGVVLAAETARKEAAGPGSLLFTMIDELNKYAPREGNSPIKDVLLDIAERGRSLGIILIGAQQTASEVERRIVANSSIKVVGRLDAAEAGRPEYGFLPPSQRTRATLAKPGHHVRQPAGDPGAAGRRVPVPGVGDPEVRVRHPAGRAGEQARRLCVQQTAEARGHPAVLTHRRARRSDHCSTRTPTEESDVKLLHTSDWHIGKTLKGRSRLDEQREVLAEIVAVARREPLDAVLIAGDLYDSVGTVGRRATTGGAGPAGAPRRPAPRSSPSPETTTTRPLSTPTDR